MNGAVRRTIDLLFEPDAVVELRAFKGRTTVGGYFDDHDQLAIETERLDGTGHAVYATLNPVNAALIARAANRVEKHPGAATTDGDVVRRRWLPIDLDPVRPSRVSSTRDEKRAALLRAREVRDCLTDLGWPEPLFGDSGNGAHLRADRGRRQDGGRLLRPRRQRDRRRVPRASRRHPRLAQDDGGDGRGRHRGRGRAVS